MDSLRFIIAHLTMANLPAGIIVDGPWLHESIPKAIPRMLTSILSRVITEYYPMLTLRDAIRAVLAIGATSSIGAGARTNSLAAVVALAYLPRADTLKVVEHMVLNDLDTTASTLLQNADASAMRDFVQRGAFDRVVREIAVRFPEGYTDPEAYLRSSGLNQTQAEWIAARV